jgi:hypothetical protein
VELGRGMLFPASYDRDPPDPPEPPTCPECEEYLDVTGDKWEWSMRCPACGYEDHGGLL